MEIRGTLKSIIFQTWYIVSAVSNGYNNDDDDDDGDGGDGDDEDDD